MSFAKHKGYIEESDTVILYLSPTSMHAIDVHPEIKNKKGALVEYVFQTSFGALKVKSLIGQKYGSKVILLFVRGYSLGIYMYILSIVGGIVQRMGVCSATKSRTVDKNIATSNANYLHTRYQYDIVPVGYQTRFSGH